MSNNFDSFFCPSTGRKITSKIEIREIIKQRKRDGYELVDASELDRTQKRLIEQKKKSDNHREKLRIKKLFNRNGFV